MERKVRYYNRSLKNTFGPKHEITTEKLIEEKMNVLEEFYVVNRENQHHIRKRLEKAITTYPKSDPAAVLDRVAREMIMASFN